VEARDLVHGRGVDDDAGGVGVAHEHIEEVAVVLSGGTRLGDEQCSGRPVGVRLVDRASA
jgi:hypothetical protein